MSGPITDTVSGQTVFVSRIHDATGADVVGTAAGPFAMSAEKPLGGTYAYTRSLGIKTKRNAELFVSFWAEAFSFLCWSRIVATHNTLTPVQATGWRVMMGTAALSLVLAALALGGLATPNSLIGPVMALALSAVSVISVVRGVTRTRASQLSALPMAVMAGALHFLWNLALPGHVFTAPVGDALALRPAVPANSGDYTPVLHEVTQGQFDNDPDRDNNPNFASIKASVGQLIGEAVASRSSEIDAINLNFIGSARLLGDADYNAYIRALVDKSQASPRTERIAFLAIDHTKGLPILESLILFPEVTLLGMNADALTLAVDLVIRQGLDAGLSVDEMRGFLGKLRVVNREWTGLLEPFAKMVAERA